jgi:hypothetical protein
MKNVTSTTPELVSFIAAVNTKKEDYRVATGLTVYSSLTVEVLREGPKYVVLGSFETIASTGEKRHGATYCFIDRATGDILKPATYKAPAKGVRGNLFAEDNGLTRCNHYGPAYNR